MSAISILTLILAGLMLLVGGKAGLTAFFSAVFNFVILFITVILITGGLPPVWVAFFAGVCILAITIYMGNKDEKTANIAFKATVDRVDRDADLDHSAGSFRSDQGFC